MDAKTRKAVAETLYAAAATLSASQTIPYSAKKLQALVSALRGFKFELNDEDLEEIADYPESKGRIEQHRLHQALEPVLNKALGRHVGLNADWSSPAWHLGSGVPNRTSGEPYLIESEDPGRYLVLVSHFDEDTGEDGDDVAEDRIEEVAELSGIEELLGWAEKALKGMDA